MGLFTECCLIAYNRDYFYITRRIEEEFNQEIKKGTGNEALSEKGFLLTVTSKVNDSFLRKHFRVNWAHKAFYLVLALFWILFLFLQITHLQ